MSPAPAHDARITILSRPGCHLCDEAHAVLTPVADEAGTGIAVVDISGDPVLEERYRDLIPVVLVDGHEIAHWRVTADRARQALAVRG